MLHLAIYGSRHQEGHIEQLTRFFNALMSRDDVALMMEERFYSYVTQLIELPRERFDVYRRLERQPDLVVSLGGDGTFLRVAKSLGRYSAPILGINTGHLGFLASMSINDVDHLLATIFEQRYRVEERTALRVTSDSPEFASPRYALNEVALMRRDIASVIDIRAELNGQPLASYRGDGLIVSTPTGSTGYNLSVGGPLVMPTTPCLIIAPVATHSLSVRPIVVSERDSVTLRFTGRAETVLLNIDGKASVLPIESEVTVTKAPFKVKVALPHEESFVNTLRQKMLWGVGNDR